MTENLRDKKYVKTKDRCVIGLAFSQHRRVGWKTPAVHVGGVERQMGAW